MKLEAFGDYVVLEEASSQMGSFTMTETHKGKVISVGGTVEENINVGDEIYYQPNKRIKLGDYFCVHRVNICCKVIE